MRFAPPGPLALEPRAFGLTLARPFEEPETETRDGVAIVRIRGPLDHHASDWTDSYEAIVARVRAALAAKPAGVVLAIDSPGGVMGGCLAAARSMREAAAKAGIPLVAFVEGQCCSAAYALACSAATILAVPSAIVGSVGVISEIVDATKLDAAMGVRVELLTSGARKADGNSHGEVTPDARAALQKLVDGLAAQFFDVVAAARGIDASAVRGLEAAVLVGPDAVGTRLVDMLCSFDEAISIAGGDPTSPSASSPPTKSKTAPKAPPPAARAASPMAISHLDVGQPMAIAGAASFAARPARPAAPTSGTHRDVKPELTPAPMAVSSSTTIARSSVDDAALRRVERMRHLLGVEPGASPCAIVGGELRLSLAYEREAHLRAARPMPAPTLAPGLSDAELRCLAAICPPEGIPAAVRTRDGSLALSASTSSAAAETRRPQAPALDALPTPLALALRSAFGIGDRHAIGISRDGTALELRAR